MALRPQAVYAPNPRSVRARSTKLSANTNGTLLVYAQGRTVVLRDLAAPAGTRLYAQHAHPVTVARLSPSGYYVASGDASGRVRIWDVVNDEHILKLEVHALRGAVHDLAWDGESKRLLVVGEGRETFTRAFFVDSGSSVGELSGHSKPVNAVAVRAQRPFRGITASDDTSAMLYHGVPFKYARTLTDHTRFVCDVAYAPDGTTCASAGADGRLVVYDGTSGDVLGPCGGDAGAHRGTIFALSYAPDSQHIASAGADAYVRVWNVAQRALVGEWHAAGGVAAQQVGLVWTRAGLVAHSFGGTLRVLRVADGVAESHAWDAPTTGLVGLAVAGGRLVAAARDGRLYAYEDGASAVPVPVSGETAPGVALAACGDRLALARLDDAVVYVSPTTTTARVATGGQPRGVHLGRDAAWVATSAGVEEHALPDGTAQRWSHAELGVDGVSCIAATGDGACLALGTEAAAVVLYRRDGAAWARVGALSNARSAITALAFSPDGSMLAVGESSGKILVYDVAQQSLRLSHWVFHTARVYSIAWSDDGQYAVSASLYVSGLTPGTRMCMCGRSRGRRGTCASRTRTRAARARRYGSAGSVLPRLATTAWCARYVAGLTQFAVEWA